MSQVHPPHSVLGRLPAMLALLALVIAIPSCSGCLGHDFAGAAVPLRPVTLTAEGSASGVTLKWSESTQATAYDVFRCAIPDGVVKDLCANSPVDGCTRIGSVTTTSQTDVPPERHKAYCYRVKACADRGQLECSDFSAGAPGAQRLEARCVAQPTDENRRAQSGQTVTLHSLVRGAVGASTVKWEQIAGPKVKLQDDAQHNASFVAPMVPGPGHQLLSFKLTGSDEKGVCDAGKIAIEVEPEGNVIVEARTKVRRALVGNAVTLHAFGRGAAQPSFAWTQPATNSPVVLLTGADTSSPRFVVPDTTASTLSFEVTYTDGADGRTAHDAVTVEVRHPVTQITDQPLIVEGPKGTKPPPQVLTLQPGALSPVAPGTPVTLQVGARGGAHGYVWSWKQTGGTSVALDNPSAPTPGFTAPPITSPELLSFEVTVTSGDEKASTAVRVPVAPPVEMKVPGASSQPTPTPVEALTPTRYVSLSRQYVAVGQKVTLHTDLTSSTWQQLAGVAAVTSGATSATLDVTGPSIRTSAELLLFTSTGLDATGAPVVETYPVEVLRTPGIAPAAAEPPLVPVVAPTRNKPLTVASVGINRADEGQTNVSIGVQAQGGTGSYVYSWTQDTKAGGPAVTLRDATTSHPSFDAPAVDGRTILVFTATVTDGGQTATTRVPIVINDLAPSLAVASLNDLAVKSGESVALLVPTASGGVPPYTVAVTQTAGASVGPLAGRNPTFTAPTLQPGGADVVLAFEYAIVDALGNRATVAEQVTVLAPPVPLAAQLTIASSMEPSTTTSFGTNVVGGVAPYTYSYAVSGGSLTIPSTANPSVAIPAVAEGTTVHYVVTLSVTDSSLPPVKVTATPVSFDVRGPPATSGAASRLDVLGQATHCVVCGDPLTHQPCDDLELILAEPSACPPGKGFCLGSVQNDAAGHTSGEIRYCGDYRTCDLDFFQANSDRPECLPYDPNKVQPSLSCAWCSSMEMGNAALPFPSLFFIVDQGGEERPFSHF